MKKLLVFLIMISTSHLVAKDSVPELTITNIDKNVYLHKSYQHVDGFGLVSANGLIVVNEQKAFIVDTPWSESVTKDLASWIKTNGYQLVGSISTHSHEDRTAGIDWLNSISIPTYASSLTNQILSKKDKALAINVLKQDESFIFNDSIQAFYPGGGHTIDNIVVWIPESKILYGGCLVKSNRSKTLGNIADAVISQWPSTMDNLLEKYGDIRIVVPGHGNYGNKSLLEHTKSLAISFKNKITVKTSNVK